MTGITQAIALREVPILASISIEIPGRPIAFARAGRGVGHSYTPAPQAAYMHHVGFIARAAMAKAGYQVMTGPVEMIYRATFAYPESWRESRKVNGAWKTSKSDTSNLVKLAEDAMEGIVFLNDQQVVRCDAEKRWGAVDHAVITIQELAEEPLP